MIDSKYYTHYVTNCTLHFYRIIDLQLIEEKADNDEYKNVEEFRADILTFVHNIIIFHGGRNTHFCLA